MPRRLVRDACVARREPEMLGLPEHHPLPASTVGGHDMRGFRNFLMRGDVIVVAVGLVVALAFSSLVTAFTTDFINPLIQSLTGGKIGLAYQIRSGSPKTT